jgi:hypothetical protein
MYQAGAYPLRKSQLLGELCWRCHYRLDEWVHCERSPY